MSYHPAFHTGAEGYIRCADCAALVADTDTATHDAFHEELERNEQRIRQLQQMYKFLADLVVPPGLKERLTEPDGLGFPEVRHV